MNWKILAVITPWTFVLFQAISKNLPKNISKFIVTAYALLAGALLMMVLHFIYDKDKSPVLTNKYMPAAIAIGVLIGLGNFGIIKAYSLGAPQSLFTILFYVLLIVYGVGFGLIFWQEKFQAIQILGLLLAIGGIFVTVYFKK